MIRTRIPAIFASIILASCKLGTPDLILSPEVNKDNSWNVGSFQVALRSANGTISITHKSDPKKILWESIPEKAFFFAASGKESVKESRGSFHIEDRIEKSCDAQRINSIALENGTLLFRGAIDCGDAVGYQFSFESLGENQLGFKAQLFAPGFNRVYLRFRSSNDESFFGFGEQFSFFNQKGKRLPIFVQEQGVGRGAQPITLGANLTAGAGGDWHTSYAGVPHYITSKMNSLFLENYEYSVFDLRDPEAVEIEVFSNQLRGRILNGNSPAELVSEYTQYAGRMRPLPDWILGGAIIGMQGGTEKVKETYAKLKTHGVTISAFWLQDWVGQRKTNFGKQLWWNWELDKDRYPNWDALVADLKTDNVSVLTYINPFIANIEGKKENLNRNLFKEAKEKGFLIKNKEDSPYEILNTDFTAGLLDVTNPEARLWMKSIIKEELINTGARGWMSDFGEALPLDAKLYSGESPDTLHNQYPEEWAKINREAIREAGRENDIVFFSRSAYSKSPGQSTLFWLGDQLVTWDEHDGIKTAVTGLLSGGLSGFSFNHSDIGGYTTINNPLKNYHRSKELFQRWAELNAFTVIFRTHEGNRPDENHQVCSDDDTMKHFAKMTKLYLSWLSYRKELVKEAAEFGWPVVRPLFFHYPDDRHTYDITSEEFLVGSDILVAPVLDSNTNSVTVYFPRGEWVHLWSQKTYGNSNMGLYAEVDAPIGYPAIFYKKGSQVGEDLAKDNLQ